MYDRVALAADEPWGLVCRDNESKQMQGFCMLGTFASWDKTLRWASRPASLGRRRLRPQLWSTDQSERTT